MTGADHHHDRTTSYEQIADEYEDSRGGQGRADAIAGALDRHLAAASTVLDVGVGTGIIGATLEHQGHRVVGIDVAPSMLARAGQRLPGRVAQAAAEALPVAAGTVDAVSMVWVLHHVADPVGALAEARRVLRPGGRVLVVGARPEEDATDVSEAFAPLLALHRVRMDPVHDVAPLAGPAGLAVVDGDEVDQRFEQSPDDLAESIERHLFSPLFHMDDETFARDVQPVVDHLRSLPHPHQPRTRTQHYPLTVLGPAGG